MRPPTNPGELEYAFWFKQRTPTCRLFGGATQEAVVRRVGGSMTAERCSRFFWPMIRALLPGWVQTAHQTRSSDLFLRQLIGVLTPPH